MSARLYGPISLDLGDGPIEATYGYDDDGRPFARLVLGEGSQQVAVSLTRTPAGTLTQLHEAIAQVATWQQRQHVREVA